MLIEIKNLSKIYRTEEIQTRALNEVCFSLDDGEFVSVMGPSGCGKSTLLNVVGMLDPANSGSYKFLDNEIVGLSENELAGVRKNNIGFIFQSFNLIDELSVRENIELPMLYQKADAETIKTRVDEVMERLNISHRASHMPAQLSGGEQQRIAVARALTTKPKLILADEPTGNLDSANGTEVMELLTELNKQGTSIIMVTHSLEHAKYAKRIVNLRDGKIL